LFPTPLDGIGSMNITAMIEYLKGELSQVRTTIEKLERLEALRVQADGQSARNSRRMVRKSAGKEKALAASASGDTKGLELGRGSVEIASSIWE